MNKWLLFIYGSVMLIAGIVLLFALPEAGKSGGMSMSSVGTGLIAMALSFD